MENKRYTEQSVPKGDRSFRPFSSQNYREMFYPQSKDSQRTGSREQKSTRLALLQESYNSLPPITLGKDYREKNMDNKLLRYNIRTPYIYPYITENQ